MKNIRVVLIGAGNVATALASYMSKYKTQIELLSVYSRNSESIRFMEEVSSMSINHICDIKKINTDADIYLFCTSDDSLEEILGMMPQTKGVWVHTSGCTAMGIMRPYHQNIAVLYPLQSISKNNIPNPSSVKIFIEACDEYSRLILERFAKILFGDINYADSQQRRAIHLAAVFACNFTNHMYAISCDILKYFGLPTDSLNHLIQHTAQKAITSDPASMQTGPAVREDFNTIFTHKKLIEEANVNIVDIYDLVTKSIIDKKNNKDTNYFINKNE